MTLSCFLLCFSQRVAVHPEAEERDRRAQGTSATEARSDGSERGDLQRIAQIHPDHGQEDGDNSVCLSSCGFISSHQRTHYPNPPTRLLHPKMLFFFARHLSGDAELPNRQMGQHVKETKIERGVLLYAGAQSKESQGDRNRSHNRGQDEQVRGHAHTVRQGKTSH